MMCVLYFCFIFQLFIMFICITSESTFGIPQNINRLKSNIKVDRMIGCKVGEDYCLYCQWKGYTECVNIYCNSPRYRGKRFSNVAKLLFPRGRNINHASSKRPNALEESHSNQRKAVFHQKGKVNVRNTRKGTVSNRRGKPISKKKTSIRNKVTVGRRVGERRQAMTDKAYAKNIFERAIASGHIIVPDLWWTQYFKDGSYIRYKHTLDINRRSGKPLKHGDIYCLECNYSRRLENCIEISCNQKKSPEKKPMYRSYKGNRKLIRWRKHSTSKRLQLHPLCRITTPRPFTKQILRPFRGKPNRRPIKAIPRPVRPILRPLKTNRRPVRLILRPLNTNRRPVRPILRTLKTNRRPVRPILRSLKTNRRPVRPILRPLKTNRKPMRPILRPLKTNRRPVRPTKHLRHWN